MILHLFSNPFVCSVCGTKRLIEAPEFETEVYALCNKCEARRHFIINLNDKND